MKRKADGFTLLEMALVLFATGFLLLVVPRLLGAGPGGQNSAATAPGSTPADQGKLAFNGFIQTHYRLPCPAATVAAGTEDCSRTTGYVPYKTLGLAKPLTNAQGYDFWYAVHADLTTATDSYVPTYKDSTSDYTRSSDLTLHNTNLLDFCATLRDTAMATPTTSKLNLRSVAAPNTPINVAWVLVDPGAADADHNGKLFDKRNRSSDSSLDFESTGRPKSSDYDDVVSASGLPQLFGELNCPTLLAAISAAAREADFANENWRVRAFLLDFRSFEYGVRQEQQSMASNQQLAAAFGLEVTVFKSVLDLGIALADPEGALAVAADIITAAAAIASAAVNVSQADDAKDSADQEVTEGLQRKTDAQAGKDAANTLLTSRRQALLQLDQRGGTQ